MSGSTSSFSDQSSSNDNNDGNHCHFLNEELRTGKFQGLTENKSNHPVVFDSDHESDSDDDPQITDEELKLYLDAVKASGGFDVPYLPGVMIRPIFDIGYHRKRLEPLCVAGMNNYNQDKKTNYEFVRLIKANHQRSGIYFTYCLTFEGRTSEKNTRIFEAEVLKAGFDGTVVQFCREKALPTERGNADR